MNTRSFFYLLAASWMAAARCLMADQTATVTEAYNIVDHGASQSTASAPAAAGTRIHDGEYVKTGAASRAELQFANKTVSRLGANTIFNYSASANQVDLQAGTILFSKPKDGKQLNIKTEAVTAAIVGTTGFIQVFKQNGHTATAFGIIEGHANVTPVGGHDPTLGPGDVLFTWPGGKTTVLHFNVPLFIKTSPLIKGFKGTLPNWSYVQAEIALYNSLVARGFITPPKFPYTTYTELGPPGFQFPTWDSSGGGNFDFNEGRRPPPMPPSSECCWCCYIPQ